MTGAAWEPPLAGSEETQLIGALERLRTTFRWKADGLAAAFPARRAAAFPARRAERICATQLPFG